MDVITGSDDTGLGVGDISPGASQPEYTHFQSPFDFREIFVRQTEGTQDP